MSLQKVVFEKPEDLTDFESRFEAIEKCYGKEVVVIEVDDSWHHGVVGETGMYGYSLETSKGNAQRNYDRIFDLYLVN